VLLFCENWVGKVKKGGCATPHCRGKQAKKRKHCQKCRIRDWRLHHPEAAIYQHIKSSAKKRNIKVTITLAQFKLWCDETGYILLKQLHKDVTIDRVNSKLGYAHGNLQILTGWENSYKSDYVNSKLGRYKELPEEELDEEIYEDEPNTDAPIGDNPF
jgi:hypothetical protein